MCIFQHACMLIICNKIVSNIYLKLRDAIPDVFIFSFSLNSISILYSVNTYNEIKFFKQKIDEKNFKTEIFIV